MSETKAAKAEARAKRREENRTARKNFWPTAKFVSKIVLKTDPTTVFLKLGVMTVNNATWSFYNTYFIAGLFNSLEAGKDVAPGPVFAMFGIMALFLAFADFASSFQQKFFARRFSVRMQKGVGRMIYKKAAGSDLACFENPEFYDKYIKAINNSSAKIEEWMQYILNSAKNVPGLIISLSFILTNDPVIFVFVILGLIAPLIIGDRQSRLWKQIEDEAAVPGRRRSYMQRTAYQAEYAKDLRLSGISKLLFRRFEDAVDEQVDIRLRHQKKLISLGMLVYEIPYLLTYLMPLAYVLVRAISFDAYGVGTALALANGVESVKWAISGTAENFNRVNQNTRFIMNLREFLDHENSIVAPAEGGIFADVRHGGSEIELRNVTFTYPGKEEPTLKNVSFRIRAGETAAVVGPNGAGKTTLVKLLLRLYDPDSGEIFLDGRDIREYDPATLTRVYATVFQDHKLFGMTLGENVLLRPAVTEADRAEATRCLELADFGEKLARLETGLDTVITREFDDNGTNFSGGEAQKIAIARVYARPSSCVILDEPTSALDPIAEARMYENMEKATSDKTVIFISHRLSSARSADRILVFDHGELCESGVHAELMAAGGLYADMFAKQAERYAETAEAAEEV